MEHCKNCPEITDVFYTIGKTYYRLEDKSVLCYRHWHQANKPKYTFKGEYYDVFSKSEMAKAKYEKFKV